MLAEVRRALIVTGIAVLALGSSSCRGMMESDFDRGNRLSEERDYRGAVLAYEAALHSAPRNVAVIRQLGLAYSAVGDRSNAINYLSAAMARAPGDTTVDLVLSQLYLAAGQSDDAIRAADAVLQRSPQNLAALNVVGSAYSSRHEANKAVEVYAKIAKLAPKDPKAHYLLGLGLFTQGESAEAIAQFETALRLSPVFYEALGKIVAADAAAGRSDAAVARVKKQIATVGDSVALEEVLAIAYIAHGDRELAETALQDVIRRAPKYVAPRVRLSELYRDWGKYDKALATVDQALKAEPKNLDLLLVQGVTYEAKGDAPNAQRSYEAALSINPSFAAAGNNLATLLAESGAGLDRALQVITAASAADPANPAITDTFGWVLFKRGDYAKAVAMLKDAALELPNEPTVAYHLGMAESKAGDLASARRELQRAATSNVAFPEKSAAQKALAALK
jgi:tetratricopeptide (TPR) repeat protein